MMYWEMDRFLLSHEVLVPRHRPNLWPVSLSWELESTFLTRLPSSLTSQPTGHRGKWQVGWTPNTASPILTAGVNCSLPGVLRGAWLGLAIPSTPPQKQRLDPHVANVCA